LLVGFDVPLVQGLRRVLGREVGPGWKRSVLVLAALHVEALGNALNVGCLVKGYRSGLEILRDVDAEVPREISGVGQLVLVL
jgi:hypothetical protein